MSDFPTTPASYYAATFTRRRLFSAAFILPLLTCCLTPVVLGLYSALSALTADHAAFACALVALAVSIIMRLIRKYAPNEEEYEYAKSRCRVRLPLLTVAVSAAICRCVIEPLEIQFEENFRWNLEDMAPIVAVGARLALGMAVMSAAVMFRYTGWFSVVQCSSVPVQSNPFENILASIRASRGYVLIDTIFSPDQRRTVSGGARATNPFLQKSRRRHPRYARPTLRRSAAQIAAHAVAGWAVASWSAIPLLVPAGAGASDSAPSSTFEIGIVCVLVSVVTVALTLLADGTSHEIRFRGRSSFTSSTSSSAADLVRSVVFSVPGEIRRRGLIPYFAFVPVVVHSASAAVLFATKTSRSAEGGSVIGEGLLGSLILGGLWTVPLLTIVAAFVSAYLVLADEMVRRFLATPHVDVDRLVYAAPPLGGEADPNAPSFLPEDLIIQLLLRENVQPIVAPRAVAAPAAGTFAGGATNLEEEEVRRNDAAALDLARSLVPLETDKDTETTEPRFSLLGTSVGGWGDGCNFLEEDLLKVIILETLGGAEADGPPSADAGSIDAVDDELRRSLRLTQRHFHALKTRVLASDSYAEGRSVQQPVIVPLIRALCSYAGGMGEALARCGGKGVAVPSGTPAASRDYPWASGTSFSSSKTPVQNQQLQRPSWARATWSLAPGAAVCAEYSILAAARLIVVHLLLRRRGGNNVSRRHSWVSLLVPAVLHSAFRLRCGCLAYAEELMARSEDAPRPVGVFIARYCPDAHHVLEACDDAAILLLQTVADLDGPRDAEVNVHDECRAWMNRLRQ